MGTPLLLAPSPPPQTLPSFLSPSLPTRSGFFLGSAGHAWFSRTGHNRDSVGPSLDYPQARLLKSFCFPTLPTLPAPPAPPRHGQLWRSLGPRWEVLQPVCKGGWRGIQLPVKGTRGLIPGPGRFHTPRAA